MNDYITEEVQKNIGLQEVLQDLPVQTDYGKAAKANMRPFFVKDITKLRRCYQDLTSFKEGLEKKADAIWNLRNMLKEIKDLRGSLQRVQKGEILNEVELFEIKNEVMIMKDLREWLLSHHEIYLDCIKLEPMTNLIAMLDPENTGIRTFYIYDAYSEKLKQIRQKKREVENTIFLQRQAIRDKIFEKTGLRSKPNGEIVLLKEDEDKVKRLLACEEVSLSSETFKSLIFRIKPSNELEPWIRELESLKAQEEDEEFEIRKMLSQQIAQYASDFYQNIEAIGQLDLMLGKVILAQKIRGVEPFIADQPVISFKEGRHIVVEAHLNRKGEVYKPIDVQLEDGVTLITGANMGGKTVTLKLIALITAMAQLGLYVPAREAVIGPVSFIYFSSGDNQSIEMGLSTFGAEIYGLSEVLKRANDKGLILIDELARGTNPLEGYGISKGIIHYLKRRHSISVITTHFDGLSNIEGIKHLQVVGLRNINIDLLKEELKSTRTYKAILEKHMDYRLEVKKDQKEVPKDAILIAKLMGLKDEIIEEAVEAIQAKQFN